MEGQGEGAIVNTSSTSGLRWTGAAQSAYAATKAGVIQFSKVGRGRICGARHPGEHGRTRSVAHAHGRGPPGRPARRRRCPMPS
ncbi:SDR family NAD(P)-dependent oxidoreductase [uncultured Roseibium sp.]|uniref:SDR family NAD(P)-dependent oxidoreductase n=1 Tax=uncultured Roseibium sp. TaxID=1936171 RepID=UPI003217179F